MVIENNFARADPWFHILSIFLLSIPVGLGGIYTNTVLQIHRLKIFSTLGILYGFFSRRSLRICSWVCWAIFSSFFMFIQFHFYNKLDWFTFFLVIPIFGFVFRIIQKKSDQELKPYISTAFTIRFTRYIVPIIMLSIYVILSLFFTDKVEYSTMNEAIIAKKANVSDITSNGLVKKVALSLAFYNGSLTFALGHLEHFTINTFLQLVLFGFGNLVIFYNACAILTCFLIPRVEYRRVFGPLSEKKIPQKVPNARIAGISAVTAFLSLFIYVPLFVGINAYVKSPDFERIEDIIGRGIKPVVNIFDGTDYRYYETGTPDSIQATTFEALVTIRLSKKQLEGQIDHAFDNIELNVDNYLDWYYSLSGEYGRLAKMLFNELDAYMIEKLDEHLKQGDAFKRVEIALNETLTNHKNALIKYNNTVQNILKNNRIIQTDSTEYQVVKTIELKNLILPLSHQDVIGFEQRLRASSGVGAATGVVTGVAVKGILEKAASKGTLKMAAKALSKVIFSKTASGIGGLIGATIGSIIPVVGTAAGAVVGGTVTALIAGVSVEMIMIELEEKMSREDFKKDMLLAIEEAKFEFKQKILNNSLRTE
ncbi:MAG: hypothetical protein CMG69_01260 [Candidatus Marinimicrobia bacterium]|nr:hypothetical protein [Candidatus Neomarinimicrobiota bacterium]